MQDLHWCSTLYTAQQHTPASRPPRANPSSLLNFKSQEAAANLYTPDSAQCASSSSCQSPHMGCKAAPASHHTWAAKAVQCKQLLPVTTHGLQRLCSASSSCQSPHMGCKGCAVQAVAPHKEQCVAATTAAAAAGCSCNASQGVVLW
jgi:hypothetical protein